MTSGERDQSAEGEYRLVMPFVVTTSVGGPYDDAAFTAGWNMGRIDYELEMCAKMGAIPRPVYMNTPLTPQIDLLAMKHGFIVQSEPWDEHPDEWTRFDFAYPSEGPDNAQ